MEKKQKNEIRVAMYFSPEEQVLLKKAKLKSGKEIKKYLLDKLKEDIRNAVVFEIMEQIRKENRQLQEIVLELIKLVNDLKDNVKEDTSKDDTDKIYILTKIKEIFKIYIEHSARLYQDEVRKKVIEKIEAIVKE